MYHQTRSYFLAGQPIHVSKLKYKDSDDAAEARYLRGVIRKIKKDQLTKTQSIVLMLLFNLHWKHKRAAGTIAPTTAVLAKRADCSVRTVKTALDTFRKSGILTVKKYGKGGRRATVYTFSTDALCAVYAPTKAVTIPGELGYHGGVSQSKPARENRAKIAREYIGIYTNGDFVAEPSGEDWWKSVVQSLDNLPHYPQSEEEFGFDALPYGEVCHA